MVTTSEVYDYHISVSPSKIFANVTVKYLSLTGGGALHQFRCPISSILHQSCDVIFSPKTVQVEKQKKHPFVWNTKIFYPANFEVERIKAAKVVPRRVFQPSFAPTVYGLRTGFIRLYGQLTCFSAFRLY